MLLWYYSLYVIRDIDMSVGYDRIGIIVLGLIQFYDYIQYYYMVLLVCSNIWINGW